VKTRDVAAIVFACGAVVCSSWLWWQITCHCDSGGDLATDSPSSTDPVAVGRSLPADDTSAEVAARLSAQAPAQPSATASAGFAGRDAVRVGVPGGLVTGLGSSLADYEDSFLPTEAGLVDMTLGVWDNPDFLDLTQDEAHELLALDDTMGLRGPDSMLSIVGPLPTEKDCRVGFQDEKVQALLREVCAYEIELVERGSVPITRRKRSTAERIELLISLRDAAALSMMERLEKVTSCKTWRIWWRAYKEWSR
jgi:hypothetical protein